MKLNPHKLGLATATSMALIYLFFIALFLLSPGRATELIAAMYFVSDTSTFVHLVEVNFHNVVLALIQALLYTYVFFWLAACIYNKLTENK